MGLITCSKCKKIYDYEKYNGICPKCARYNRKISSAQEHQEYHDKYDGGYSHTTQDDHHSFHQRYDDNKNPHASGLEGVQETLRGVMGAEHAADLSEKSLGKKPADKKSKLIVGILFAVIIINIIPFAGILVIPAALSYFIYVVNKKK